MRNVFLTALIAVRLQVAPLTSVQGVVLKVGTNEPIAKVTVELRHSDGGENRTYTVSTADNGRFEFRAIPGGQYQLFASRSGYVKASYGERRPGGPGIPIAVPGEVPTNLRITMTPTGVIAGRILDRNGQPLGNATVQALQVSYVQGVRRLAEVQSTLTNDLGEYRLFWLTPGQYYVGAMPTMGARRSIGSGGAGGDSLLVFRIQPEASTLKSRATDEVGAMVFYPGTPDDRSAVPIDVAPSAEIRRIDFLVAPVLTRHIRGVVVSAEPGQVLTGSPTLRLFSGSGGRVTGSPSTTFDLTAVFPGTYVLSAQLDGMSGSTPVEVRDQDVNNLVVSISKSFSLSGRVVVEDATASNPGPDLKSLRVSFRPDPDTGVIPTAPTPTADGSFVVQPLYLGTYRISVGPALQNAYLKSIRFEDREVLTTGLRLDSAPSSPVTIVISANAGTITGTVTALKNEKQQPMPNAIVVLVPDKEAPLRTQLFKSVRSDSIGQFRITAITPGSYRLFAWEEVENGAWLNAEFMRALEEQGMAIEIRDGDMKSVSLSAILN